MSFALDVALLGVGGLLVAAYVQRSLIRTLTRSEKRHRLIIKAAREWIITTDTAGKITSTNESTLEITGRSSEDVVGRAFEDLLDETNRAVATAEIRATLLDGIGRTFLSGYRSKTGELCWIQCSSSRFHGEKGAMEMLLVCHEATDRLREKRRESLLAATEQIAHLGSWELDINTGTVEWSDELYRIFRIERNGQLTTADFYSRVHPDDVERVRATVVRSSQTGETFEFDHRIIVLPNEIRNLHVIARVVLGRDGSPASMLGSVQDLTDRTLLTEQLRQSQKMEAVGRLAGGIAHDFNNVLTVIKAYSGFLIQDLPGDGAARADAEEISKAADKAGALTKQLLIFTSHQTVEPRVIDLNASVGSLKEMVKRISGTEVKVEVGLQSELWCVRADPGLIEQVLMNLVLNARDSMPNGGLIRIETANAVPGPELAGGKAMDSGNFVMLSVCDTGSGMTEETRARIFEPFFTTKEIGKGTGLGLSIVYGIVAQAGGYVTVDTAVGRGTTIKVYLPHVDSDATAAEAAAPFAGVRGGSETILLIEDEDAVRSAVKRILQGGGYEVLEASSGGEGLAMWQSGIQDIALVLTDLMMPGMGGKELAHRVRLRGTRIPILFMSAYTHDPSASSDLDENEAFIGKPFTADSLLLNVRGLLDGNEYGLTNGALPGIRKRRTPFSVRPAS